MTTDARREAALYLIHCAAESICRARDAIDGAVAHLTGLSYATEAKARLAGLSTRLQGEAAKVRALAADERVRLDHEPGEQT